MSIQSQTIRQPWQLSRRQRDILSLLADGETTQGIALHLHLSAKTVEYHRKVLMDKVNLHSYQELTKLALRLGLTQPDV